MISPAPSELGVGSEGPDARLFGQHAVAEGARLRFGFRSQDTYLFDADGQRVRA